MSTVQQPCILFFHGFNSSATTNKFTIFKDVIKVGYTVKYQRLTHHEVSVLYDKFIEQTQPDILVGHSLGGYWALLKSRETGIPCLAINPTLHPHKTFDDYVDLKTLDFHDGVPRALHLELNDEVIAQREVQEWAEDETSNTLIFSYADEHGHHRVNYLPELNLELKQLVKKILGE